MKIPPQEWKRANPRCQGNGSTSRDPCVGNIQRAPRRPNQIAWQERIGFAPAQKKMKNRISEQQNRRHNSERKLKSCREKLISIEREKNYRRRGETIEHKNSSIGEKASKQHGSHDGRANAGNVQSRHRGVEEQ